MGRPGRRLLPAKGSGRLLMLMLLGLICTFARGVNAEEPFTEVLLAVRDGKLLAFSARGNNWVEKPLMLKEHVVSQTARGNVGVVITDKRILAFSAFTNRWHSEDLKLRETIRSVTVEGNAAVVMTDRRLLGFNAHTGNWVEAR